MSSVKRITQDYFSSLKFHSSPESGGQIVLEYHAVDEDGLWCRRYDQSDRTSTYYFAKYPDDATEQDMVFEPWNCVLPNHDDWQSVVIEEI